MTSPRLSKRRHLALMSATVTEGLSSIRMSVWLRAAEAMHSLLHSSSLSLPVASFCSSTKPSLASRRMASCSRDISRLKMATVFLYFFATLTPIFSAKADLPMAGRAAMSRRSDLFSPLIRVSKSRRPVDRPGIRESDWLSSVRRSNTLCSGVPMCSRESPRSPLRRA